MLDLALPGEERIDDAVEEIMNLADRRPTLVCCALGYSRSANVSAAWLIAQPATPSVWTTLWRR